MTKQNISRDDFRLLYNNIIIKANPVEATNLNSVKNLLPHSSNKSKYFGTTPKYQDNPISLNYKIFNNPLRINIFEILNYKGTMYFGANLLAKKKDWEDKREIITLEDPYFLAFYIFIFSDEQILAINDEEPPNRLAKIRAIINSIQETLREGDLNPNLDQLSKTNYYICYYYSAIIYGVKRFGLSLTFSDEGEVNAKEWGYHTAWRDDNPLMDILYFDQDNIVEGVKLKDIELERENKQQIINNIEYSGPCLHDSDTLYCNLKKVDSNTQMNIILKTPATLIEVRDKSRILKGVMQTKADDGCLVSLEILLVKVDEQASILPMDVTKLNTIGVSQADLNMICLYLMFNRRLLRVSNQLIPTLNQLKAKGVPLENYLKKLPGVYRVWNLGMQGQIIQSRIVVTEDFRVYLTPFFRHQDQLDSYKAQWCLFNISHRYPNKVSIISNVGMAHINHAIIDFSFTFHGERIYAGIFSSVGHDISRETWEKDGVVGGYMIVKKEDVTFKVREFIIDSDDFDNYVNDFNLKTFKTAFFDLISSKYRQVKDNRITLLEEKLKTCKSLLSEFEKQYRDM
ncbi:MAG: hypothetical protein U0U46_05670 [Saprospiraceae bacterium]